MKQAIMICVGLALLIAAPNRSYGQYFQSLYDNNATYDWGWCISQKTDGNYFILGWNENGSSGGNSIFNMTISKNGGALIDRKSLIAENRTIATGTPGQLMPLIDGGYLAPLNLQWPNPANGFVYSAAGMIRYNSSGDTVFLKTYTDTGIYLDVMLTGSVISDEGYIIGGKRGINVPSHYPGYIIRTDNNGDTLWTKAIQKDTAQSVIVNNIIPLQDGRIVIAASSKYVVEFDGGFTYDHNSPWFLVLDANGNILKDTLYSNNMIVGNVSVCNSLCSDINGGYIHIGIFTSYTSDNEDIRNFPGYIAHLDTNFRITWIIPLGYSDIDGHRQGVTVRQLHDGNYIVLGDMATHYAPYDLGWATKIDRNGKTIWSRSYYSDTDHSNYLRDMVENPDGSLVFIGASYNDTCPPSRGGQDVWLLGVDSNGCENGFCAPVRVVAPVPVQEGVSVYPNPTEGHFTINCAGAGTLGVYNMQGQPVAAYSIKAGATDLQLPVAISPGVYVCRYIPTRAAGAPVVVRLVVK